MQIESSGKLQSGIFYINFFLSSNQTKSLHYGKEKKITAKQRNDFHP